MFQTPLKIKIQFSVQCKKNYEKCEMGKVDEKNISVEIVCIQKHID